VQNANGKVINYEAEGNESVSVNDCAKTLWKVVMVNENGHGHEYLLTRASESGCGRFGELT
jgi:hypothetical protein